MSIATVLDALLAGSRRQAADALLRLPDAVWVIHADELRQALAGDKDLSLFADVKLAACHAVREADGLLSTRHGKPLWEMLRAMSAFAAGKGERSGPSRP